MAPPTYNTYITVGAITGELATDDGVGRAIDRCRRAGVGKVVLEAYRGGTVIDENALRRLRDAFQAGGLQTSGGLMPVHGNDFGKLAVGAETRCRFFCYSEEDTRSRLEAEVRKLARLFDEVVIDDALLTSCRCERCDQARAGRTWDAYRRDLMLAFSRRLVEAAHDENATARLILKLPQYYDRYERFGYDPVGQGEVYDGVWVGTEIRNPARPAYGYVQPYQPWFHVHWVRQCVGEKLCGAWFDFIDCDDQLFYEQAVATTLTEPGQITLFCYGEPMFAEAGGVAWRITRDRGLLDRLGRLAAGPIGVPALRPPGSDGDGDLFLFDALGMLGIPLAPVLSVDGNLRNVIVTAHGAVDPNTAPRILEIIANGGQVVLTLNALSRMIDAAGLANAFGYGPSGVGVMRSHVTSFSVGEDVIESAQPCRIAGDLMPRDADVPVWAIVATCEGGPHRVPLLTVKHHTSGGRAIVWNVEGCRHSDFPISERLNVPVRPSLLDYPQPVVDALRDTALRPLGIQLRAPACVTAYLFRRCLVLANYRDVSARIGFAGLDCHPNEAFSDSADTHCTADCADLAPRSLLAIPLADAVPDG